MDSQWEFDCPQFVDFTAPAVGDDDDEADKFFDTETNLEYIGALPAEKEVEEADPAFETPVATMDKIKAQFKKRDKEKSTGKTEKSEGRVKREGKKEEVEEEEKEEENGESAEEESMKEESGKEETEVEMVSEEGSEESAVEESTEQEQELKTPRRSSRNKSSGTSESEDVKEETKTKKTPSNNSTRRMRTRSTPFRGTPSANSAKKTALYGRAERTRSASCGRPKVTPSRESAESTRSEGTAALHAQAPNMKPKLAQMSPSVLRKRLATTMKAGASGAPVSSAPSAANNSKSMKTSEQIELERIQKMREDLEKQKRQFKTTFQKAMTAAGTQPIRARIPATQPKEFHFTSDQRLKSHERSKSTGQEPPDFSRTLRSKSVTTTSTSQDVSQEQEPKIKPKLTMPQPFNLSHGRKRKSDSTTTEPLKASERFKSVAEQVQNFARKTPDRFRTSRRSGGPSPSKQCKMDKPKLTVPKTPNFQTKTRLRPVTVMSQAEIEEQEIEEIKRYKFKANPVNEKVMSSSNLGVKPVAPKEPTVPIGFDLGTERRRDPADKSMEEEERHEFHARPVPKSVLNPLPMKPLKLIAPTVPESPAFALKNRLRPKAQSPELKEKKRSISRPVPCPGIPFAPVLEHRVTEIEPFSFEQRTEEMMRRKEMMQMMKEEEEMQQGREFHANPMPDLSSPDMLPAVPRKGATIPEPFPLSADVRGVKRAEEWANKMQEEMKKQREMATFHAKPAVVTKTKPFEPKRSSRPVTDITDFELNTERRAQDRQEFEKWKMEKEYEEAERMRQKQREQEEKEREEVERLRREATFKANNVRQYRPVEVRASTKTLTVPATPRFSKRLRTRSMRM